jgi:hypothetical protein
MRPNGVRDCAQILQPREGLTSTRVIVKRGDECVQIIADVHRDLRVGKQTPHRTRQILVTHFRNPAPSGVVNRQRQAGLEHGARLFWIAASGKIDLPQFGIRETAAGREQRLHRRVDDSGIGQAEGFDELRTKARQGSDRERFAAGINPGRR